MCLGMSDDILASAERCASTSNRNFKGQQERGGTHLVSTTIAAGVAILWCLIDVREIMR